MHSDEKPSRSTPPIKYQATENLPIKKAPGEYCQTINPLLLSNLEKDVPEKSAPSTHAAKLM
jgi:hypothetical protein